MYEEIEMEKRRIISAKNKKKSESNARKNLESIEDATMKNNLAPEDDATDRKSFENIDKSFKPKFDQDESGIFDKKPEEAEEPNIDEDDEIFDILNDSPAEDKSKPSRTRHEETKQPPSQHNETAEFVIGKKDYNQHIDSNEGQQKTVKTKHIFEINVKELKNVPILKKILKDLNRGDKFSHGKVENKYIQDVFVKYIFPLDDEQITSDYLEYSPTSDDSMDYKVSMHSYHTYLLEPEKSVISSLGKCGESFTLSLSCLKDGQDMNIGNVTMPIDDLIRLAEDYEHVEGIDMNHKQAKSSRILFLHGTKFSQRQELLIGKMAVEFIYKQELVETNSNRGAGVSIANDLYLQKEVYINRKIPLNGYLNINVGALSDLKNSLENVEYLMSLYNDPDSRDNMCDRSLLSAHHFDENKRTDNIDRKRALLKIYKEGLNIGVTCSIFDESQALKERFGSHETNIIFRTLNPNFEYVHEYRLQMDTSIFEHLKYRFAVYEVRHYFVNNNDSLLDLGRKDDSRSEENSEFDTDKRDYITLGYAKVSLANLITKSNGIDQDVVVLDQFNQKLGYLKVKMSLNYQSKKNLKLMKEPAEKQIEGKYLLGFSFVELISQNNRYLTSYSMDTEIKHLVFKFKWNGENHRVRYIPEASTTDELPLNLKVYNIHKMLFVNLDINDETFEKSATPIEIQVWTKIENKTRCMNDKEELIGSVFVDLQTLLTQRLNPLLRNESQSTINTHDGYYTLVQNEEDTLMNDRLGLTTMIIKEEFAGQKEQLENMFYKLHNKVRPQILEDYDLNLKGTIEINDMKKVIDAHFKDRDELDFVYKYIDFCELKNPDTIYYSPYMNTLPPFFKYARRIDKEQIIEFIYRRLSSVDNYSNGFVENNMFKSILECEANLKEKIVDNFIDNLKPNPLDYNLITHTMKSRKDYLLLIRKLYGYLQHWDLLDSDIAAKAEEVLEKNVPTVIRELKPSLTKSCDLSIRIQAAKNTYVCFRNPFETRELELITPAVYKNTYPQWSHEHDITGIPVADIRSFALKHPFVFEIYDKQHPGDSINLNQEFVLIGKAHVDASSLAKDIECSEVGGYYHIFKNEEDRDLDDYRITKEVTQGQLRIQLQVNKPLLAEFEAQNTDKRVQVIQEADTALQTALKKARKLGERRKTEKQEETKKKESTSLERKEKDEQENQDSNLVNASLSELRVKKDQNFRELDDLLTKLKGSLSHVASDPYGEEMVMEEDDFARATSQS